MMKWIPLRTTLCALVGVGGSVLQPRLLDLCCAQARMNIQLAHGPFAVLSVTFSALSAHFVAAQPHLLFHTLVITLKDPFCRKRLCINIGVAMYAPNVNSPRALRTGGFHGQLRIQLTCLCGGFLK